jgi:putative ABC transport system ATP-binding protein
MGVYVITAKNVSKKYIKGNQKNILFKDMSLHVHEGEVVFISGHYGSGRTTLLKMIAAMTPPNHGTIEVLGKNLLTIEKRADWRLKHIGFLTSEDCLIPYLNVKQHLLMGQDEDAADFHFLNDEVQYILSMLGIDEQKLSLYPDSLTKVDRLKITIARILMANPRLMLLDELTTGLNDEEQHDIYSVLINYVKRQNITLIITGGTDSCHFFDRTLKLVDGKLVEINDEQLRILH